MPRRQAHGSAAVLVLAVVLLLAATACSRERGDSAGTTVPLTRTLDSVDGQVGALQLLHVHIASPGERGAGHAADGDVELFLTLANAGPEPDVLTAVTADGAAAALLRDGDAEPTAQLAVEVPPGGVAPLRDVTGPHLELTGLTDPLAGGTRVDVTFTFRDAGPVTLPVPVAVYEGREPPTPSDDPAEPT
jgi:copper(I)-binding protein